MHKPTIALVDCNNFYASCERVFNPKLRNRPIIVLSNNDGCIIARSEEAKKLNIPMGAPIHQWLSYIKRHRVHIYSSNYALYGDLSNRVFQCLQNFTPDLEAYSIDEAFLNFNKHPDFCLQTILQEVPLKLRQWTGIPVSIGLASSKTLAKLANHQAKKRNIGGYALTDQKEIDFLLRQTPIDAIWGIGKRWGQKLHTLNIRTAYDFKCTPAQTVRKVLSVVGLRIHQELHGIPALQFEDTAPPKKNILYSRSFGTKVTDYNDLAEALSYYCARAALKMRRQNSHTQALVTYIRSNSFQPQHLYYRNSWRHPFLTPTDRTDLLIKAARTSLKKIYKPDIQYHKAGIMLLDLIPSHQSQTDLFAPEACSEKKELMQALDQINARYGKNSLYYAAEGMQKHWQMKQAYKSPHYTTQLSDIPLVS